MMKALSLGRYFPGTSLLHRADPRTKIILAVVLVAVVYGVESFSSFLVLAAALLLLAGLAGKPVTDSLRGLRPVLCLALIALVCNGLLVKGAPVADHGILSHFSREGITLAAKIVMRLFLLVSGAALLTGTTTPLALTDGLERLLKPLGRFGIPIHDIALMVSLALRFIPDLADEAGRIIRAQSSRSAEFAVGGLITRTRSYLPLLVPLLAGAFRRGDELATAMEARCYRGGAGRSRLRQLAFSGADIACFSVMVSLTALVTLIEHLTV
jgi:energy-coupling factor transport system permease protein